MIETWRDRIAAPRRSDTVSAGPTQSQRGRATTWGVALPAAWNSLPNAPQRFEPQHIACPVVLIAQVWEAPAVMAIAWMPVTVLGVSTV